MNLESLYKSETGKNVQKNEVDLIICEFMPEHYLIRRDDVSDVNIGSQRYPKISIKGEFEEWLEQKVKEIPIYNS